MRKLFITASMVATMFAANAQDMNSKNGTPILPETGNWSIGFDAVPVLNYFGNIFNNTANNSVSMSYQQPFTIVGLYVVDDNTAYRAKFRLGFGSTTWNNIVDQDGSTSTPPATVIDELKSGGSAITIGGGIQKNRGKGRLRGIYGAEISIMLTSGKDTYTYGNAFNTTTNNNQPTSTDWTQPITGGGFNSAQVSSRPTETKNGSTFGFGLRGFIGAEYFFAPKMSVSAEYGWGLGLNSTGEGESTVEYYDFTSNSVKTSTSKTGKASSFGLDVDNSGGAIVMHFYF